MIQLKQDPELWATVMLPPFTGKSEDNLCHTRGITHQQMHIKVAQSGGRDLGPRFLFYDYMDFGLSLGSSFLSFSICKEEGNLCQPSDVHCSRDQQLLK